MTTYDAVSLESDVLFKDIFVCRPEGSMAKADKIFDIIESLRTLNKAEQFDMLAQKIKSTYRLQNVAYHGAFVPGRIKSIDLLFLTYDHHWVTTYLQENYFRVDPIEACVVNAATPVDWDHVDKTSTSETRQFFKEADSYGVGRHGVSIPVRHPNGGYGIFTFTSNASEREWETEKRQKLADLNLIATHFHSRVIELFSSVSGEPNIGNPLSARELRLLELFALGFEVKQISGIISLSETTIRNDLRCAGLKLGCSNPNKSVTTAILRGLIKPKDLRMLIATEK